MEPISSPYRSSHTGLVAAAAVLGAALVIGTLVIGFTIYRMRALSNTVAVTGSAEQVIDSDIIKWTANFSRTVSVNGLESGYAGMTRDLVAIKSFLKDRGVDESQISVKPSYLNTNYEASEKYGYGSGPISGYTIRQSIAVESPDVAKITAIAQDAPAALISSGVVLTTENIEYYYSKFADLKVEMLAAATRNAYERAAQIVGSTDSKIGALQSSSMGVFQVTSVNSTEISDYGYFDTSAIQKKVTAVVRASFSIK